MNDALHASLMNGFHGYSSAERAGPELPKFSAELEAQLEFHEVLGEGGMGVVRRVFDRRLGRFAALKVLRASSRGLERQTRFVREAKIMSGLDHPNVPAVFDFGQSSSGELVMLMRLVDGKTLNERIQELHSEGPEDAPSRELLEALVKVAETLEYAHSKGIVHRDVKPHNIMIGRFGQVFLMDWGIAKDPAQEFAARLTGGLEVDLTVSGEAIGTPGYMSPEQAGGDGLSGRSDVYALGLVLGEIILGRPMVQGSSPVALTTANLKGQVAGLAALPAKLSAELRWVLLEALKPDPEERTSSAQGFATSLRAALAHERPEGMPWTLSDSLRRWIQGHPLALAGFALFVALVAIASLAIGQQRNAVQRAELEARRAREAEDQERVARARSDDLQAALKLFDLARMQARRGQAQLARLALDEAFSKAGVSYESLISAARILKDGGDKKGAFELLDRAIALAPPGLSALAEKHAIESQEGDSMSESLKTILALCEGRKEEDEFSLTARALKHYQGGRVEEAIESLNKAETYNPNFAVIYEIRGRLALFQRRFADARSDFDKALQLDPRFVQALSNRASVLLALREFDAAERDFNLAIELAPEAGGLYANRAALFASTRRVDKALEDFSKALELCADRPRVRATILVNRARLRMGQSDGSAALKDAAQAVTEDPSSPDVRLVYAELLNRSGDRDGAIRELNVVLDLRPSASAFASRAELRAAKGELAAAQSDLTEALRLAPDDINVLIAKSRVHEASKDYRGAFEALNRAIEAEPNNLNALKARGRLKVLMQDINGSIQDYSLALRLSNRDVQLYAARANSYRRLGDMAAFRRDLNRIIALAPKSNEGLRAAEWLAANPE